MEILHLCTSEAPGAIAQWCRVSSQTWKLHMGLLKDGRTLLRRVHVSGVGESTCRQVEGV